MSIRYRVRGRISRFLRSKRRGGCVSGGVSVPMTVEPAETPDAIWRTVEQAIAVCGPAGGFILSPVDNLMDMSPAAGRNVIEFVRAWQHCRSL